MTQSFTSVGLMKGDVVFVVEKMTEILQLAQDFTQPVTAQWLFLILTAGGDVRTKLQSSV